MLCDNCNRCPYAEYTENRIVFYCGLGFPIECKNGKLPRELQQREDYNGK